MRCLCIGICQIGAIATILRDTPSFASVYDDIINYTIFSISREEMEDILENIVPTCDLVLSQPVSDNYRGSDIFSTDVLRRKISPGCKHYVVSNCYFSGYDPVPFQTTDKNGDIIHLDGISYFPALSVKSLLKGDVQQSCVDWCNIDGYDITSLNKNYNRSMGELKRRESKIFDTNYSVDITISDYIEEYYKLKFLFNTYNHPTNILLYEITRRILNKLGINSTDIGNNIKDELLGDNIIPPPPTVYFKMDMLFEYPFFTIKHSKHTTQTAMQFFSDVLAKSETNLHEQWICTIKYGNALLTN